MRLRTAFLLLFIFLILGSQAAEGQLAADNPQPAIRNPKSRVLVELFTAEGCPTCPPAGKALAAMQKEQPFAETEVITLAFHVDYWNQRGWADKFSSPLFSQRQEFYTRKFRIPASYTPQMIVDGSFEFVGSNQEKTKQLIADAAKSAKAKIELEKNGEILKVKISDLPKHENATVFLAIAEDNLASEVKRNSSFTLKLEHSSVVRELRFVGSLPATEQSFSAEHAFQLQPDWKKENIKLVVFIQEIKSRRIIGVNSLKIQ